MPSPSTVLLRTQSDERLVALARGGHDRAFEAIVERYRKQLLRACRRILPEARAEDALQQALLAAWAALSRGDEVVELRPWLFRIVRNTALNQLRVAGYDLDELVETLSAADDPEDEVARREVVRQTLAAVAALPDRQREALLGTAIEGRAQADVARDLGLSSTAMRQLVHRARVSVRTAATALVPMPVATWLCSAGGATATATLAKAGTVAVLAGGAVTAPTLIHHDRPPVRQRAEAHAATRERPRAAPTPAPTVAPPATAAPAARVLAASEPVSHRRVDGDDARTLQRHDGRDDDGHHGSSERSGDDDSRGSDDSHNRSDDDGHDNRGSDDGGGHNGSGDGDSRGDGGPEEGDDGHDVSGGDEVAGDDGDSSGPGDGLPSGGGEDLSGGDDAPSDDDHESYGDD
ncbi:MAG TPA: sigma-70 family RNA polymerase sigma factor [Solirubrobacteraceae bacterium]|nr:sigma-70 family RNA polymerase sigma factor [Solirubrobacteraceae bacterium]